MRFDALAFDLDGTLYPAHRLYARALPLMLVNARRLSAFSAARRTMRAQGMGGLERGPLFAGYSQDAEGFRAIEARLVATELGLGVDAARSMMERVFYGVVPELFARVRLFRGLRGALARLEAAGLRLALLSDLPPQRKLEVMGLGGIFDPTLCSEDSGFLKPAREPFAMLASRLGLPPERILYVGNSPRIDVAGAKAAGMGAAIISLRQVAGADLSFRRWGRLVDFALRG